MKLGDRKDVHLLSILRPRNVPSVPAVLHDSGECIVRIVTRNIYQYILHVAIVSVAFAGFTACAWKAQADAPITPQAQQIIEFMRERRHSFERGDASAWGMHVAERCVLIEAGGRVLSKAQRMAEIRPVAGTEAFVGYTFSAVVSDIRATDFGDTIILTYRENDTETYTRLKGEWQLIAWTENSLPAAPPTVKLNPQLYDKYVGTYEVNPKATFTVTRDGNRLMGRYAGEEKFELLPASKSNFFTHGDSAVYAFFGIDQGT